MAFTPSASAFALPLPQWQQPPSRRVAKYESKKRKNHYDTGEEDSDSQNSDNDGETTDAVSDLGLTDPSVILPAEQAHQYRVAGLPFHEELPGGQFPHGPVKEKNRRPNNNTAIHKQLSALSPPVYVPQSPAHQGNLRLHHLAVLTTVLHRCLLECDYIRAGRAWGLILREQFGGRSIDVRTEDRWGIGAEILLRRDRQMSDRLRDDGSTGDRGTGSSTFSKLLFTRKGFEDAKTYYMELITRYPHMSSAPNATSALHFWPAMFGLWIYVTHEESVVARNALDDEDVEIENSDYNDWLEEHRRLTSEVREKELAEATKIAASMDNTMSSPPYSDSPELLELRAMVSLWMADLVISSLPSGGSDEEEYGGDHDLSSVDYSDDIMSRSLPDSIEARQARHEAHSKRQQELATSHELMAKARQKRQELSSKFQRLHIEDNVHNTEIASNSKQALAEQARVEVPETALIAPVPISANGRAPIERYGSPFLRDQAPAEKQVYRDAFDTDVEGIDESTIAATSVLGGDEVPLQYRLSPAIHAINNANAITNGNGNPNAAVQFQAQSHHSPSPSPSPQRRLRAGRRANDAKWYEGLGDRALKSAGFDLDELDDISQLTSTAGDDEQSNDTDDQRFVSRYRGGEEPLSRRLQNFWSASRRAYEPTVTREHVEPSKPQSHLPVAAATKPLAASARKVTLQRSMTATPRTRFSPPKPSLLDQLDLTPTRRSPGLTRTHSRKERGGERERKHERERERERERDRENDTIRPTTSFRDRDDNEEGLGLFTNSNLGHTNLDESLQSLNVFDMTNFDDLENDSSMNDPFSRRASMRRIEPEIGAGNQITKKRPRDLEPDYPPEILATKTFTELQAEPFDHTPTLPPIPPKTQTPKPKSTQDPSQIAKAPEQLPTEDQITYLLRLNPQEQNAYFSTLSLDEWESCGDSLIDEFGKLMGKMKDLRCERRATAKIFEDEIKRRHEVVEEQSQEITGKFEEMRAGGAEVLRGRSP
ncbi:extracellular mutant protein 11-domain-containing protein [Aspergillus stella-maris]|uniref:extracellular mutant protein 11-domain-containing protein n=1 Tax=Aspergillus stella-maris TaxID=1810926 RepID=UPI003CCDA019